MSAAAAICIIFGVYGITGIFSYPDIAPFSLLSWGITIISFSGLFAVLFTRKRRT